MENSVAYFFDASYGAIYPALKRMEKEGFIEKEIIQQEGKPNKNLYVITSQGKEEFLNYMESPLNSTLIRSDLLIRIFFGRYTSTENINTWLRLEMQKAKDQLENLSKINEIYPTMEPFKKMTLLYGIENAKFTLDWTEKQLNQINKGDE